jgi:hypothetical protein
MLIRKPFDIPSSEITPQASYKEFFSRRRFLRSTIAGTADAGPSDRRRPARQRHFTPPERSGRHKAADSEERTQGRSGAEM